MRTLDREIFTWHAIEKKIILIPTQIRRSVEHAENDGLLGRLVAGLECIDVREGSQTVRLKAQKADLGEGAQWTWFA